MNILRKIKRLKKYRGKLPYLFLIGVAIYLLFKAKSKWSITSVNSVGSISVSKSNLTLNEGELDVITRSILDCMNRYGTDEKTIFENFEDLNGDEVKYVFKKFGEVKYNGFGKSVIGAVGDSLNLQGWLKQELSKTGKYSYDNLKAMLIKKGVNLL